MNFQTITINQLAEEADRVSAQVLDHVRPCVDKSEIIELLNHVTGLKRSINAQQIAQAVCDALFDAPGVDNKMYEIPKEFWRTIMGQAVRFIRLEQLPSSSLIESADACLLLSVSKETLRLWRESKRLIAVDRGGRTGGFQYRKRDVLRALKEQKKRNA